MKTIFACLILINSIGLNAQSDDEDVRKVVISFFEALSAKDTSAIATRFTEDTNIQTLLPNASEKTHIIMMSDFFFELGMLKDHKFNEEIYGLTIKTDMNLAMVWHHTLSILMKNSAIAVLT